MGYSGNCEPQYIVPTTIATKAAVGGNAREEALDDIDFYIGNEAHAHSAMNYQVSARGAWCRHTWGGS